MAFLSKADDDGTRNVGLIQRHNSLAQRAKGRCEMQAVTGIFASQMKAEQAVRKLQAGGLQADRVTLLSPGEKGLKKLESVPMDSTEQPGMGTAIGAVVGGAAGLSGGLAAVVPGVGPVAAIGLLGAAILSAAGASLGALAGGSIENLMTEGLPEDEIFVYEDALRKGRSVVIALAEDAAEARPIRELLKSEGAEAIDAARKEWWIGLRSAEQEHYLKSGRSFYDDENFYRMGFEAALHARIRCQEFDQVSAEMASDLEELERQHPGAEVADPFTRGYQRGREYYQRLCKEEKAA
jgi:hypothetical protein